MPLLEVHKVTKITATVTLDKPIAETLDRYAAFINAAADDVINKAVQFVFAKDKDFHQFLQSDAANAVPHSLRIKSAPNSNGKGRGRAKANAVGGIAWIAWERDYSWWRQCIEQAHHVVCETTLIVHLEERCCASD